MRKTHRLLATCVIMVILAIPLIYFEPKPETKIFHTLGPQYADIVHWLSKHTTWHQRGTSQGWAGFDKVYFISMSSRLSNVTAVSERLEINTSAWILNALQRNNISVEDLRDLHIVDQDLLAHSMGIGFGAIGCQLSHLAVLLDCYKDPIAKSCVIFEDDLYKPAKLVTTQINELRTTIEKLGINWDIIYLDYCYEPGGGKVLQDIRWLQACECTHAMVIRKPVIPTIFAASFPIKQSYDATLKDLMRNKKIVAIGPNHARYFSQNRKACGSHITPEDANYPAYTLRFMR